MFLVLFLTMSTILNDIIVQIDHAPLRTGPGVAYPVIAELYRGAVIIVLDDEEEGWARVQSGDFTGYLSKRAYGPRSDAETLSLRQRSQRVRKEISPSGYSAAVRSFSNRFATRFNVPISQLNALEGRVVDVARYEAFKKETYKERRQRSYFRNHRLPKLPQDMTFYPADEEGLGLAIAGSLASEGLVRNASLEEYVSFIGFHVAEASHSYDLGFRFFILDKEEQDAFSTPGGFVFITRGLLTSLTNEAQLAAILAHEVASVTLRKGLRELDRRKNVLASDDAFRDLDSAVERSDAEADLEADLSAELLRYRDRMYSMRQEDDIRETDRLALSYLLRAGYTPIALLEAVNLMGANPSHALPVYRRNELDNRRQALIQELAKTTWRQYQMTGEVRFSRMVRR